MRNMAAIERSTSASVVAHEITLTRIAVFPCQTVTPHPAGSLVLDGRDHATRPLGIAEGDEHLIEHDVVQHRKPRVTEGVGKAPGLAAVAFHQVGEPFLPSARSAAQASTPRGRRDTSGV